MKKLTTLDTEKTGQKIKQIIQNSGYSVREIQRMLQLQCPQPIYRWMSGVTLPSIDNLFSLSKLLEVPMEEFLVDVQESKQIDLLAEEEVDTENNLG